MGKVVFTPWKIDCALCGTPMRVHQFQSPVDPMLLQCSNIHCDQHGVMLEYFPVVVELNHAEQITSAA